jgi:3-phenylpropionate/trans-cinnamate dioxygenase ferredoxin reductase subunit
MPRRSSATGHALPGIYYLRQRAEADAIRTAAQSGRRAVVIGASYLEVAFSLQELGLSVTLIEAGPRIFPLLEGIAKVKAAGACKGRPASIDAA